MTLNKILLFLLAAFVGGVVAITALLIAFALSTRSSSGLLSVHFGGGGEITFYKDLRLLDSGVRNGKLYVKYENVGDTTTTTACFKVKVYDADDRLIDTLSGSQHQEVVLPQAWHQKKVSLSGPFRSSDGCCQDQSS